MARGPSEATRPTGAYAAPSPLVKLWRRAGPAVALAVACLLSGPGVVNGATRSTTRTSYGIWLQTAFDSAGNPLVVGNFVPDGSLAIPSFSVCPPDEACQSRPPSRELEPGPEPAGTEITARASYAGQTYTASATWLGQVRAITPPVLSGRPSQGNTVEPVAARWQGGWSSDGDQLGVEACRTATGRDCVMLSGAQLGCPVRDAGARLGGWFVGWYVFALDARSPQFEICDLILYAQGAVPVWPVGPTIARSQALERITGQRDTVSFPRHATLRGGRLSVARVRCPVSCPVSYWATQGDSGFRILTTRITGAGLLSVVADGLHRGIVDVHVYVDDSPSISGKTDF